MKNLFIERSCLISTNREYRWSLSFKLTKSIKEIIFIGLNPSLSDTNYIDNTTRKIIKICKNNNYGNLKIINLFALIAKNPHELLIHQKPIGYLNNKFINKNLKYWSENKNCHLWLGWGNNGIYFNRNNKISKKISNSYSIKKDKFNNPLGPLFIKKTKKQNPIHPLYCSDNSVLKAK
ncbi:Uncharacterized protein conserved in bacteria [Prochlorococcus marinus str. MIT 9515]|uniref:Uncharacterized protein conserved in bacteria n=1 Tax=Prochlorococcus marinus (strain MIT 9515) TaxID=167542 RepID=A2BY79_PROM5|nr:DUF1643 domain-containing protein [Prochlorococcus marinus]ABM72740.1 Uncharacterized protein conserved in bacteria [Prochlorococcus marinus str. MIT 9515]